MAASGITNTAVSTLVIGPAATGTLYAGTFFSGVRKSTNAGAASGGGDTGLMDTTVLALAIDPAATGTLYAGTNGGCVQEYERRRPLGHQRPDEDGCACPGIRPGGYRHDLRRDLWRRVQEHERRRELERGQHRPDQ